MWSDTLPMGHWIWRLPLEQGSLLHQWRKRWLPSLLIFTGNSFSFSIAKALSSRPPMNPYLSFPIAVDSRTSNSAAVSNTWLRLALSSQLTLLLFLVRCGIRDHMHTHKGHYHVDLCAHRAWHNCDMMPTARCARKETVSLIFNLA